jgi:hypothetical protein
VKQNVALKDKTLRAQINGKSNVISNADGNKQKITVQPLFKKL